MFGNSWNLGTISGIRIRLHWSFVLLPVWIYFSSIMSGSGFAAAVAALVFVLAIFGCVVLHELGHALAARQFGIATRDITLLPFGGVAALERMPRNPFQELWVAVAGPLVNVVIATVVVAGLAISPAVAASSAGHFLWQLAFANMVLVVFNLIPAFPMDGGRVLRSVLAMFMDYARATSIAALVGQTAAVGLGMLGLLSGNFMLILIAGFVFLAARAENFHVAAGEPHAVRFVRSANSFAERGSPGSNDEIALLDETVPASLPVSSVAAWLASQRRDRCAVVESGHVIGSITRSQLIAAICRGLGRLPVGQLVGT